LTRADITDLARLIPGVDEAIEFPPKASAKELFVKAKALDEIGFDAVIDLHGNLRSFYLKKRISAPLKIQYPKRRWQRALATRKGKKKRIIDSPPHTIDLYNISVKAAGGTIHAFRPSLRLSAAKSQPLFSRKDSPIIALAPGASFPVKRWPLAKFRRLAIDIYARLNANLLLVLTSAEKEMLSLKNEIPNDRLKILMDENLGSLGRFVSLADILICNDSALSHLGSAVGTPVIAIFGPTHPTLGFAPRGMKDIIVQTDEFCRPCSLHGRAECYRKEQYCFSRISPGDILAEIQRMIESGAKGEKGLFIDRDGTLIKEKHFLQDPDDVEPEEGSICAVKKAKEAGYKIVVLSNQSGIARGYFTEETVNKINARILEAFNREGAAIDDILFCPHLPEATVEKYAKECACRKPSPGMLETACARHNINPFRSYVIGDKISDINLAYAAGAKGILVRTGYGMKNMEIIKSANALQPEFIADNLFEGVNYILNMESLGAI
jgi:histidinol-phosphate phosphatase family protein